MNAAIYRPSDIEVSQLQQVISLPGYQVLEKIFMSELDLMQVAIMNVDGGQPNYRDILSAKHAEAKGGAVFYTKVCEKIADYVARAREKNAPAIMPDVTEELIQD